MKTRLTSLALAVSAVLSLPLPLLAQAQPGGGAGAGAGAATGVLLGDVKEALRGVALGGALVSVAGQQVFTDSGGSFRLGGLPAGTHTLTIDFLGYERYTAQVSVRAGVAVRADATLQAAAETGRAAMQVEIRGQRSAQALALNQQRASSNVVNVVSADLLGQFPDNNIAESTQRIPGVSIERDQGEGRYVTVRGAPKEFTTVSLDGVPLANPDAASRGVELDTVPADVIAALEVTKALTPDMDGDAIAGNINIRTQSALDRKGMTLRASLGLGKFELGSGDNQRASLTLGNRFGEQGNIGVLISASQSKQGRFTDNVETVYGPGNGGFLPTEVQIKDYEGTRTRTGITGRVDWRLNDDHQFQFVASDARFRDREFRDNQIMALDRHSAVSNQTTGVARATFDKELRERTYNKSIQTFSLSGEHWLQDWKAHWQLSRSTADKETKPRMQYIFRSTVRPDVAYDYSNPDFPVWNIRGRADAPAAGLSLPESWFGFRRLNDRYEYGDEKETGVRLDLSRDLDWLGSNEGQIKFGLRARMRDKSFDDERRRNGSAADFNALGITMSDMLCSELGNSNNFNYFDVGRRFCRDIFQRYAGPLQASANHVRLIPDSIVGDYRASEDVQAAYLRLDGRWNALSVITGLRFERTQAEGSAIQFNTDTGATLPRTAIRDYDHVLPSLHLRYEFNRDRILRASYSTGLNRPDFIQTAPFRTIGDSETSPVTEGNPAVKAAYAHNLDISFEQYLRPLGLVSAGVFFKRINDPLFVASRDELLASGLRRSVTRPENGSAGRVEGLELAWQQTLDMLPAPFDGLGLYANYTFAKSSAQLPFGLGKTELPGTSRNNYNLAVSYEKHGITTRLAYNHRSRFIQAFDVSNPALNVYWDARSSVDFSLAYQPTKQWRLFVEGNNLTDSRQARFQGERSRVLELEGFGRSWLAGVRFDY